MAKRFILLFVVVCILLLSVPLTAFGGDTEGMLIYENKGTYIEITGYDDSASWELEIPASIEGLPVTHIADMAFAGCDKLSVLILPDSLISIGVGAFCGCDFLRSVYIPSGVTSIGEHALGYSLNSEFEFVLVAGFVIMGEGESAAAVYAEDNGIVFTSYKPNAYIINAVKPTCTENGYTGDLYDPDSDTIIAYGGQLPPKMHADAYYINIVEATCTTDGHTGQLYCPDCDSIIDEGEAIPAFNHSHAYRINILSPTTDKDGYTGDLYCPYCGETLEQGEVIPKIEYRKPQLIVDSQRVGNTIEVLVSLPEVDMLQSCVVSVEFDESVVSIDDTGNYAACSEGDTGMTPNFSGVNLGGISALSSNVVKQAFMTATYVSTQEQTPFALFVFNITDSDAVQAVFKINVEQYTDIDTDINNTYLYSLQDVMICNHANVYLKDAVDAACTADGYTGDLCCSDCGEIIEKGEVIPMLGHIEQEWAVTEQATFHDNGSEQKACEICGEVLEIREIPKIKLSGTDKDIVIVLGSGFDTDLLACRAAGKKVSYIKSLFGSDNIEIFRDDVKLNDDEFVGTGCEIRLFDGVEVIDTLIAVVVGDVDGNGLVEVDDARTVLRVSVHLESFDDNPYRFAAGDVLAPGNDISVEDARKVLRVAVGLEKF